MVRLIRMLAELDQHDEVDTFMRRLTNYMRSPAEWVLAAGLAKELGRKELAIYVAKQAVDAGVVLDRHGYPTLSLTRVARPGDRKSTRLNSSPYCASRMPTSG